MENNSVITLKARIKLAKARAGEITLPVISGIAIGDGAEKGGAIRTPSETDVRLNNELIRKESSTITKISDAAYRYRIDLETDELSGKIINEAALYDADGDLLAIKTFKGKPKDGDIEMAFEFDDIF